MLKIASRTRSVIGRVVAPPGTSNLRPRNLPPMIRIRTTLSAAWRRNNRRPVRPAQARPLRNRRFGLTRAGNLADICYGMLYDLRTILEGWAYEPGKISVRKIIGRDGREKVQTRVDLGVLQFEPEGRPDGVRPFGCPSLLDYFERRLDEYIERTGSDEGFVLSPEACRELRHEGYLYYQRYLSFFVLEEFDKVERDTARNLRLIDFCGTYADADYDRDALETQRPYVFMMNVRARVYDLLAAREFDAAMRQVERGICELRELLEADREALWDDKSEPLELRVLHSLRQEVLTRLPANCIARIQHELHEAIDREDYERAAELRDRLAAASRVSHA
jgi:hypothetical protein